MLNLILISIATAAGLSGDPPVIFVNEQATLRVKLADYDLSSAAERRRLHRKIVWAAGKVCDATIPGAIQNEAFACAKDTIADAQHQLDIIIAEHRVGTPLTAAIAVSAVRK